MSRTALSPLGSILCADLKLGEEPFSVPRDFKTASKLDFGHLGYEALSLNTLSFDPVPGFFNIG